MAVDDSFPLLYSRTQHFTLGNPRSFAIAPGGHRVVFLRSASGTDARLHLWSLDIAGDECEEREIVDPTTLLVEGDESLSADERARRERIRESAAGIVAYSTDEAVRTAAFAMSGRLFTADLVNGTTREITTRTPVADPRLSRDGSTIAYVCSGELRVVAADGADDRAIATPDGDNVTFGLADFIAAEEFRRFRGHWWSPAGNRLLVERVDESAVGQWWISDPSDPAAESRSIRYPAAGTPNADVRLSIVDLDGRAVEVDWDRDALPYVVDVAWSNSMPPLVYVMSRDQATAAALSVDVETGATTPILEQHDDAWVERVDGAPRWTPDGRLVHVEDADDVRRLVIDGTVLTGADLHIRAVVDASDDAVVFVASSGVASSDTEIGETHVYRVAVDDRGRPPQRLSDEPGEHNAVCGGGLTVLTSATLTSSAQVTRVLRDDRPIVQVDSHAVEPGFAPRFELVELGDRRIPTVVQLPSGYADGDGLLPVLIASYAGPVVPTVLCSLRMQLLTQWFADQGFAVLVIDGRGTPGHSVSWEKAVRHDLAGPTLDDQI
ncbi:MAG TPA: DPP IV N-terminal domain-containing protein, partial [Nocardioidaceae bacterium]|nr:DPP IV N-terminal domain-containing protein [Nocardioidaceae bacterium]